MAVGLAKNGIDEEGKGRGPAVVCSLSLAQVHAAVTLSDKMVAKDDDSYVSKLVLETAKRAADLTKLSMSTQSSKDIAPGAIWSQHKEIPAPPKEKQEAMLEARESIGNPHYLSEWITRYEKWSYLTFVDSDTPTPTMQQKQVLLTVYYRTVREEYALAGEEVPNSFC